MLLSIACLKICEVFCFFADVQKVCGAKFGSDITPHAQLEQPPSWHLWALGSLPRWLPLPVGSAGAGSGKCPSAGPGSLGLFLLFICHFSIATDTSLDATAFLFLFLGPDSPLRCICCGRGKKRPCDTVFAIRGQTSPCQWGPVTALHSLLAFAL